MDTQPVETKYYTQQAVQNPASSAVFHRFLIFLVDRRTRDLQINHLLTTIIGGTMSDTLTLRAFVATAPTLRTTASGVPVTNFRVASTPRWYDQAAGVYREGDTNCFAVDSPCFVTGCNFALCLRGFSLFI